MALLDKYKPIFEKNLIVLHDTHPEIAVRISHHIPSSNFHWIETETQDPSLELDIGDGSKPVLFHSRHNPKQEGLRQIVSLTPDSPSVYFFAGLGLGYNVECLWEQYPRSISSLLLLERDLDVFYFFLHRRDWTLLLKNPRVRIIITDSPVKIIAEAQSFLPHIMGSGIRFVDHQPSFQRHPIFYSATIEQVRLFLKRAAAECEFLIQHGALIQRNAILNLPAMCCSHGLGPLRDYYRNQPAVLIAAGPSLNKNLHQLIPHRSKVLVFCVDTAYRLVREKGIVPDFVAATDPTELNLKHFDGIESNPHEVLIFESDVYPQIPRNWKGSSIFLNSEKSAINRWIEEIAGPFGCFEQGLSVGHTLFNAAAWMQCNPLILIGFDLAYPTDGGNTHANGTLYNRKVDKASLEKDRVTIHPASFHPETTHERIEWVLGVRGDRVPTSRTMAVFLHELSHCIKELDLTVFDATEGGALIEGSIPTQLGSVLSSLEEPKADCDIVPFLEDHRDPQELRRLQAFDQLISGLESAQKITQNGLKLSRILWDKAQASPTTPIQETPEWKDMDRLFWDIYRDVNVQAALGQSLFPCLFLFIRQEKDESALSRLQKYTNVFESVIRLSNEFIPYLEKSRELIAQSCTADSETVESLKVEEEV